MSSLAAKQVKLKADPPTKAEFIDSCIRCKEQQQAKGILGGLLSQLDTKSSLNFSDCTKAAENIMKELYKGYLYLTDIAPKVSEGHIICHFVPPICLHGHNLWSNYSLCNYSLSL